MRQRQNVCHFADDEFIFIFHWNLDFPHCNNPDILDQNFTAGKQDLRATVGMISIAISRDQNQHEPHGTSYNRIEFCTIHVHFKHLSKYKDVRSTFPGVRGAIYTIMRINPFPNEITYEGNSKVSIQKTHTPGHTHLHCTGACFSLHNPPDT